MRQGVILYQHHTGGVYYKTCKALSNIKTVFPRYGDSHVKDKTVVRPSFFNMEIPLLVRHLYIEMAPWSHLSIGSLGTNLNDILYQIVILFLRKYIWKCAMQNISRLRSNILLYVGAIFVLAAGIGFRFYCWYIIFWIHSWPPAWGN